MTSQAVFWLVSVSCTIAGSPDARHRAGAHGCADTDHGDSERIPYEGSGDGEKGGNDEHSGLTLPEFIYSTYNSLFEGGWRMAEIDRMDILGFLKPRAWNANREKKKKEPRRAFIDEVWSGLTPSIT